MSKPYASNGGKPVFHEFMTPIGLIVHLYHDKPQLKTKDQFGKVPDIDPKTGIQLAEFKVTLAWSKTRIGELGEIIALAGQVKAEGWPESQPTPQNPQPFFALEPFFRDGDNPAHNTQGRDYLKGRYYLNLKQKATATKDSFGQVLYGGAPELRGPNGPGHIIMPTDIYPGCTGRASGIVSTEYMGKHFISTRLNNIQLYQEGERIGGGQRPSADSQFTSLTGQQPLQQPSPLGQPNPFGTQMGGYGFAPNAMGGGNGTII